MPAGLSIKCEHTEDGIGWYIVYDREDKALAGPYDFIEEARLMASLLSCFDWNRPAYKFTRRELGDINQMITLYRADTGWFKELIVETWREHISPYSGKGKKKTGAQLSLNPVWLPGPMSHMPAGDIPEGCHHA
jgi:hypothetical protein